MSDVGRVLTVPAVRRYFASAFLSSVGIWLLLAVLFKQVYDITEDELTIGFLGLLQFLPAVAFVMVSGYLADRFDRRRITSVFVVGRALCALALVWYSLDIGDVRDGSDAAIWPIYLLTLAFGSVDALAIPARRAIPPLIVERGLLPNLFAVNAMVFVAGTIVGPILGGFLYTVSAPLAYGVAAALFVASIPPLLAVTYVTEPTRSTDRPTLAAALGGISFIRRSPIVLSAIALDLFAVLFGGAVALIPVIAEERLGVGDIAYGWLRAAPGIGAFATGIVLAARPVRRRVGSTLLWVVALFGVGHIVLGLTTSYVVAFAAFVFAAGVDMVSMTIRSTLVPLATPDDQLGRVVAVEAVFIGASNELGAFESGVAARWFGVPWSIAGGGIATVLIAAGFAAFVPALRRIDTYDEVDPLLVEGRRGSLGVS